ncbi:MAG: gliding motility-associated C-terminal domain-containing protein [Bacteroidales bacterium]|nr:gliding motility-associated C-terminal domain-containing protein [Bacteroidales bacterium]
MQNRIYKRMALVLLLVLTLADAQARRERDTLGTGPRVSFVENAGHWDSRVRYEAQLHNAAVFLESDGITVALRTPIPHPGPQTAPVRHHAYRMHFPGASAANPSGLQPQEGYSNYYLGSDPSRWRSRVRSYSVVHYAGLWPGIDLDLFSSSNALKYNFIVAPGADPSPICMAYEGTEGIALDRDGNLLVKTTVRDIVELKPYVYQLDGGREVPVAARWEIGKDGVRIALGPYDHGKELVVDPLLIFSTYTGSTADNWGTTAAYDSEKNSYTAGLVFSIGYPTSIGAYQPAAGGGVDIGIFKFDTLGSQRLFATYLGGSSSDMPHSMFVNSFDELLIFGTTGSGDFPVTADAYCTQFNGGQQIDYESSTIRYPNGSDIFVSRLSADGTQMLASTYIGGSGNDGLNYRNYYNNNILVTMQGNDSLYYNYGDGARGEIITDNLNNIYVGTTTMSANFPVTAGCVQPQRGGGQDGVVFKLDHNLRNLLWSTYLGGAGDDAVYSIDVDSEYNLLVCGGTNSRNFPTTEHAWQPLYGGGGADGFVSKISYNGDRLMASTYVGMNLYDQLYFVRTGRHDEVFLFGQTKPTGGAAFIYNAGYSVPNSGMLLMRMHPLLDSLVWSTTFGTPGRVNLSPTAFAADICNRVYAAGWGRDFVGYGSNRWYTAGTAGMETTPGAWSDSTDGQDFYILSLDENANQLEYATFFGELHDGPDNNYRGGGDHVDGGTSRFDRLATLYQSVCASCGGYNGFPISAGAWRDSNYAANCNNALFRFNVTDNFPVAEFVPPTAGCAPYNVHFSNTGRGTSFLWNFGDGGYSTSRNPSHTYMHGGIYTVTLIAYLPGGCAEADTQRHTLHVIGKGQSFTPSISCQGTSIQIGMQPQIGATYQWMTEGVSDPTIANPYVTQAGTYLMRISVPGCSEVDTFEVHTYDLLDTLIVTPPSCHDYSDAAIELVLGQGIHPDSVQATFTGGYSAMPAPTRHGDTLRYAPLPAGIAALYTLTGYGCSVNGIVRVPNPPMPQYTKSQSPALCHDSCTAWIRILQEGYSDTLVSNLCEGTYVLSLTDRHGCPFSDTSVVQRNRALDHFHAWADATDIYHGNSVTLHSTPIPGARYRWEPDTDLESPNDSATRATPADTFNVYTVNVSHNGCKSSDTVHIRAKMISCGAPEFVIPNAFTPNGDGVNDEIDLSNSILAELHIAIFNRWGQCVFECNNPSDCRWDGTFRNTPCLPGVYTYTCRIRCNNGEENEFKGDITLIR